MRIQVASFSTVLGVVLLAPACAESQDIPNSRSMPANEAPAGPYIFYWGGISQTAPQGRPENSWRYRLWDGRWWYWTAENSWSYFTGDTWVPYTPEADRFLSHRSTIGPPAGPHSGPGVIVRGTSAGLTLIPGDRPSTPHLKRGTVLPKYLKQEPLPEGNAVEP